MGKLIPFYVQEIVPGDKFKVNSEIFMRFSPLIAPVMHRVNVTTHYFFVPNRLTWDNWQDFITGGEDGTYEGQVPYLQIGETYKLNYGKSSLADYMGIPVMDNITDPVTQSLSFSALPFRAYQMIYNEYYRDQSLGAKVVFSTGDEAREQDTVALTTLRTRAWEKDYFTSCLPEAQKGGEVGIPVDFNYTDASLLYYESDGSLLTQTDALGATIDGKMADNHAQNHIPIRVENLEEEGVQVSINELRKASRLQEWLEANARGGSRYVESILNHFGERVPDHRLQRPEFLGGGRQNVVISEVLQTSATNTQDTAVDASVQGNMAGHGISIGRNNGFSRKFQEHGVVIGIMSVLPRTAYQQGLDRFWSKLDKFDFYWPEFAHLGEQEVISGEVYYNPGDPAKTHEETFGYQERYAEYKYAQSRVSGDFRSDELNFWHMGRIFDTRPVLNEEFITADPTDRIFAVTEASNQDLYVQILNNVRALRPMPYFGTPRL